jgi:hypothetical protein
LAYSGGGICLFAMRNLSRLTLPPHIICLFGYLAFAGASVLWAFKPEMSLILFSQQAMIVTSIVIPALLAARTADMMWGVFLCFAFALISRVTSSLSFFEGLPFWRWSATHR